MKCARLVVCLVGALLLAACGEVHHVFPPAVTIEQLGTPPQGDWNATLRVHNQSYDANVHFDHIQLDLTIADVSAGHINQPLELDVAERNSNVVVVHFAPSAAVRKTIKQAGDNAMRYALAGSVTLRDENDRSQQYDVDHQGWLSPVPGIDHLYR